jgi:mono/diheme cytochrome c family protein
VTCHQLIFADEEHALFTGQPKGDAQAGARLYAQLCATCHGDDGTTPVGDQDAVINSEAYWGSHDDAAILRDVGMGSHGQMTAFAQNYGGPLSWKEILDLVAVIRSWGPLRLPETTPTAGASFSANVLPLFQEHCVSCHSATQSLGGWDGSSYEGVVNSGDHAPNNVIPGDPEGSLLVQKMRGTQTIGAQMPIAELLLPAQVQIIVDWIQAGAMDN